MTDTPMIWTSKGNMPLSVLQPDAKWTINENEIVCAAEMWYEGECVRREVHVYKLRGEGVVSAGGLNHG